MHPPPRVCVLLAGAAIAASATVVGCGDDAQPEPATTASSPEVRIAEHGDRAVGGTGDAPADERSIPAEPQGSEPDRGTPGAQDATGGKVDIALRDRRFVPGLMRVKAGQIVVFTNEDAVPHTVRATSTRYPRSGAIPPGGRFEFTPPRAGRVVYHCAIHPDMDGRLVVRRR